MARAAKGEVTCAVCGKPDLKVIGTVTISGRGANGALHLTSHRNDETGRTCKGMDSRALIRLVTGW